jgi:hypothetical protein
VLLLALAGCGPADAPLTREAPSRPAPSAEPRTVLPPVFDVPGLRGLSIEQVRAALGPVAGADTEPTRDDVRAGVVEWTKKFQRDTTTLLVTYEVATGRVLDFYVTTAHGRSTDYRPWLELVGVPADDPRWSIEPFAVPGRPSLYLGVRMAAQ